ncbi:hypothetical protein L4X63_00210 [Geomonas sp. Red32]|uniref:hypothetical protein n=1 Tax=Geomonas sp. Red32 TaxID=2912856 RepID=UPI00202CCD37|nr:hypothetical protein [Geomonas sp. Red32]MCM0080004.1 hypothetical protein [Geomonas sp. Red32]
MKCCIRALLWGLFLILCGCATEMVKRLPKQVEDVGEVKSACMAGNELFVDYVPYLYHTRLGLAYDKDMKPSSVGDQQRISFNLGRINQLTPRQFGHRLNSYTRKKLVELVYEPETHTRGGRFIPITVAKYSTFDTKCNVTVPVYTDVDDAITTDEPIALILERFGEAPENYYQYLMFQHEDNNIEIISLPALPLKESESPAWKVVSYTLYPFAIVWDVATFPVQIPLAMRSLGDGATRSFP